MTTEQVTITFASGQGGAKPPRERIFAPPCKPTVPLAICPHEGAVVTYCVRGEDGHLRRCEHAEVEWDNCRRTGGGPGEGSCDKCPYHPSKIVVPAATCRDMPASAGGTSYPAPTRRHLAYYIYPLPNGLWQWNVEQLKRRWSLFNGRKIVVVAQGGRRYIRMRYRPTARIEDVKAAFGDSSVEFIDIENHPAVGEVSALPQLLDRLLPGEPEDVIFYAHAKGVTKQNHDAISVSQQWASAMYETCLDYWPLAAKQLEEYYMTGSLKIGGGLAHGSRWQYSGTFMWMRAQEVAKRPWREKLPWAWAGVEDVWGLVFAPEEVGNLYHGCREADIYSNERWANRIGPEFVKWKAENEQWRANYE